MLRFSGDIGTIDSLFPGFFNSSCRLTFYIIVSLAGVTLMSGIGAVVPSLLTTVVAKNNRTPVTSALFVSQHHRMRHFALDILMRNVCMYVSNIF